MVKVYGWALWHSLPNHLRSLLQECFFFCGLYTPSCCSWVLSAVSPFMGGVNLSGWLTIRVNLDHCEWDADQVQPFEVKLFPERYCAYQNPPLGVPHVWLVGSGSGVVWNPPLVVLVLGLVGWDSGAGWCQTCITGLGYLSGATTLLILWATSTGPRFVWRGQSVYKGRLPPD